nr:MAG TPA_asm: hypothetical protein [Caudoviricetes sp.]
MKRSGNYLLNNFLNSALLVIALLIQSLPSLPLYSHLVLCQLIKIR